MASTFSSDHTYHPNPAFFTLQDQVAQSNVNPMHYGLTMWLGQEDCFYPFLNNFGCSDDMLLSKYPSNVIDCSSNDSSSLMQFPSLGTSAFDYYCNQSNVYATSPASTYDELESNVYSSLQGYVPSANNYVATPPECWVIGGQGYQGHTAQVTQSENISTKVGRYSVEERKDRILRYLKKRNQRNFRKTIKYACRKILADRRVRIRGRFAKNQEEESAMNYNNPIAKDNSDALTFHDKNEQCGDIINEEWVHEAMSSLLYVPYFSGWHPDRATSF